MGGRAKEVVVVTKAEVVGRRELWKKTLGEEA